MKRTTVQWMKTFSPLFHHARHETADLFLFFTKAQLYSHVMAYCKVAIFKAKIVNWTHKFDFNFFIKPLYTLLHKASTHSLLLQISPFFLTVQLLPFHPLIFCDYNCPNPVFELFLKLIKWYTIPSLKQDWSYLHQNSL